MPETPKFHMTAPLNNSLNRSANSVGFMRETLLLWQFVAPAQFGR
jgi:hypothetical protein